MRYCVLGGTLDPVHLGHVAAALNVRDALHLDEAWLMPSGDPPHKPHVTGRMDRLRMAELAAEDIDGLTAAPIEAQRPGITYTVDTLAALREQYPDAEWHYIIGADTLPVVHLWKDFNRVAKMCRFALILREGFDGVDVDETIHQLRGTYGAEIDRINYTGPDISSTNIRVKRMRGESITGLVPQKVEDYIIENGLYLCPYSWDAIKEKLKAVLKPGRYTHTLGVADTAKRLAPRYGVDPWRAYLAGLLHDCAKSEPVELMRERVRREVPDTDEVELQADSVLHAPMGMLLAREQYGIQDEEILSAIRKHTLGGESMTPLETLIYVADYIEPNRKPFDGLNEIRALAETDIDAAARKGAECTTRYVRSTGGTPHERTQFILNMRRS